jgi:hypothetical protein
LVFNLPYDSLISRFDRLPYQPKYVNPDYLIDRLNDFKIERVHEAVQKTAIVNSLERPLLVNYQALYRAMTRKTEEPIVKSFVEDPYLAVMPPIVIILFFLLSLLGRRKRRNFGLFLYLLAGLVSLSMELISFYIYQSLAGSLYSEMGILIGAFMLGLALGTWYSIRLGGARLEYPALLLLLTAAVVFLATYGRVSPSILIFYHILFLFTVAVATGSLFVAATDRFYFGRSRTNRGLGYAFEIIGSSIGALFSVAIFLPLIGLQWLIGSFIILIALSLGGAYINE